MEKNPCRRPVFLPLSSIVLILTVAFTLPAAAGEPVAFVGKETSPGSQMPAEAPSSESSAYTLGPGDILEIAVWKDAALTKTVIVLPDGTISFPLIGQMKAAGESVEQMQVELQKRLDPLVPDPEVSVVVNQVNSMLIYVIGKVNRPGHYNLNRRVDVLQSLSMAGGLNTFADGREILIFRKTPAGTRILAFDYEEVSRGENLVQNIELERGDVILVP